METPLSSAQIDAFRQQGFLLLKNFESGSACDAMLAIAREHVQQAVAPLEYESEVGYEGAPASLDAPGGRTARRLRAAWQRDEHFRAWASDPRIVAALHQLFGESVHITLAHHNCIMTKHPTFGTATGWHRDIRYWSFPRNDLISVWLALGPEHASNGGLRFIPGSHLLKLRPEQMDDLDFLRPDVEANKALFARGIDISLGKGDVVLFHSGLFHAAGKNDSDQIKTSVVFAYHGQSNLPVPGTRSAAADDIQLD